MRGVVDGALSLSLSLSLALASTHAVLLLLRPLASSLRKLPRAPPPRTRISASSTASQADDRISGLPDDVIIIILSFLPIRDAVQTSVLSSRWKNCWRNLPTLCLHWRHIIGHDPSDKYPHEHVRACQKVNDYIQIVDTILKHHYGKLERFTIYCPLVESHGLYIDRWVAFALSLGARVIELFFWDLYKTGSDVRRYSLNGDNINALVEAKLEHLLLAGMNWHPRTVGGHFASLKSINLRSVSLTWDDLHELLSECSLLQSLVLHECKSITYFELTSCSLQDLNILRCSNLQKVKLSSSQNLSLFQYAGYGARLRWIVGDGLSLSLTCPKDTEMDLVSKVMIDVLTMLPLVDTLKLICCSFLERKWLSPPFVFDNIRKLKVFARYKSEGDLLWVIPFIRELPLLNHLLLEFDCTAAAASDNDIVNNNNIEEQEVSDKRLLAPCLEKFEICGFTGLFYECKLATDILRMAPNLKRITINPNAKQHVAYGVRRCFVPSAELVQYARRMASHNFKLKVTSRCELIIM